MGKEGDTTPCNARPSTPISTRITENAVNQNGIICTIGNTDSRNESVGACEDCIRLSSKVNKLKSRVAELAADKAAERGSVTILSIERQEKIDGGA